jgi:hypothetical protein
MRLTCFIMHKKAHQYWIGDQGSLTKSELLAQAQFPDRSCRATQQLPAPGIATRQVQQHPAQNTVADKTLQQHQPTEMSQVRLVERKRQCSQAFEHREPRENAAFWVPAQPSLKVNFVPDGLKSLQLLKIKDESNDCSHHSRIFEVETVLRLGPAQNTPLKQGVNERNPFRMAMFVIHPG